jgi:hypothetical protein
MAQQLMAPIYQAGFPKDGTLRDLIQLMAW